MVGPLPNTSDQGIRERKRISQLLARKLKFPDVQKKNLADAYICLEDVKEIWFQADAIPAALHPADLSPRRVMCIRNELIKLLSILVFIRADDYLDKFEEHFFNQDGTLAFSDRDLPLEEKDLPDLGDYVLGQRFLHDQYLFLPSPKPKDIDCRDRLPFEDCSTPVLAGAYGVVTKVKISARYFGTKEGYNINLLANPKFAACKRFPSSSLSLSVDAKKELENLQILKESFNQNEFIRIHLAILFHGREQIILLPWAEHLDLHLFLLEGKDILATESTYEFQQKFPGVKPGTFVRDVFAQLVNIAEALKFLHEGVTTWKPPRRKMYFAHMDLKPSNVLIDYHEESAVGKWVLTDFGISAFKEFENDSNDDADKLVSIRQYLEKQQYNTINTTPKRLPGAWGAPELENHMVKPNSSDADQSEGNVGRMSDIWSFGCIFAEVLAFAIGQGATVKAFREKRKGHGNDYFYEAASETLALEISPKDLRVRKQVRDWLRDTSQRHPEPNGIVACSVATIEEILQIDSWKRPKALELVEKMQHVERHLQSKPKDSLCPAHEIVPPVMQRGRKTNLDIQLPRRRLRSPSIFQTDPSERTTTLHETPTTTNEAKVSNNTKFHPKHINPDQETMFECPDQGSIGLPTTPLLDSREGNHASGKPSNDRTRQWSIHDAQQNQSADTRGNNSRPVSRAETSSQKTRPSIDSRSSGHRRTLFPKNKKGAFKPVHEYSHTLASGNVQGISLCSSRLVVAAILAQTSNRMTRYYLEFYDLCLNGLKLKTRELECGLPLGVTWDKISVCANAFVVWGKDDNDEIEVYFGYRGLSSKRMRCKESRYRWLNLLRVAIISKYGRAVFVCNKCIYYIDLAEANKDPQILCTAGKDEAFKHGAFSEDCNTIYVFSAGSKIDCVRVWRRENFDVPFPSDPEKREYRALKLAKTPVSVVPFKGADGCVVHVGENQFFCSTSNSSNGGLQVSSIELEYKVGAISMYGTDSLLIAKPKPWSSGIEIAERSLTNKSDYRFHDKDELAYLQPKKPVWKMLADMEVGNDEKGNAVIVLITDNGDVIFIGLDTV